MPVLTTIVAERIQLRPFSLEDAPWVQKLAGDYAIADTTLNLPHPYLDGMAENWISGHAEAFENRESLTLAIVDTLPNALVGAISLMGMTQGYRAELGYWIGKPYWGRGFCTEAARLMLNYAFEQLGMRRVYSSHLARNPASGRVMQKIGMKYEGTQKRHIQKWEKLEDLVLYGILYEEWQAVTRDAEQQTRQMGRNQLRDR
jgi:[ribosomal protein S5]-alanine N-acetyltransferase